MTKLNNTGIHTTHATQRSYITKDNRHNKLIFCFSARKRSGLIQPILSITRATKNTDK